MLDLELSRPARRAVTQAGEVTPDEEVLVFAEPNDVDLARAVLRAVRAVGATGMLTVMPQLDAHGNEPPATVAKAMQTADVVFTVTTHAVTHTQSRLAATDAGTRIVVLRGVTTDMMIEGAMNTDFEELRDVTESVRDKMTVAAAARVTSPAGTDVTLDLGGRDAFSLDGYYHDVYGFATLPPGEAPTSPRSSGSSGSVVIDYSMDNLGELDEPIELTFENGTVTEISGGRDADRLRDLVSRSDDNAGNLAEFAIGTNRHARLIGNLAEDKKKRGTVHFAIGDDTSLGGTRESSIHLDGLVREPTVRLDGETVVENGELRLD